MQSLDDSTRPATCERTQFWQQHFIGWRNSGLSKRHYCKQHDLVYHQMIYWCAKSDEPNNTAGTVAGGFTQIAVSSQAPTLSIELPNGVKINNLTPQTIAFLPALLQSL